MADDRMTAPLVTGGVVRRNERDEASRAWLVGADRVLRWKGLSDAGGEVPAIPGDAPVLCCDPWARPLAVLTSGEAFHASVRSGQRPQWIGAGNLIEGRKSNMVMTTKRRSPEAEPFLVHGWIERRQGQRKIVAVTVERRVLLLNEDAPALVVGPGLIPGDVEVLAVECNGVNDATVLLADGRVLVAAAGRWIEMARLVPPVEGEAAASGLVGMIALKGFRLDRERVVKPGDSFEVDTERARELIRFGWGRVLERGAP